MRRLGAILMMLGANIAIGSLVAAFWRASYACAAASPHGTCEEGAVRLFLHLMGSGTGLLFWLVVIAGLVVFWRGKQIRARS